MKCLYVPAYVLGMVLTIESQNGRRDGHMTDVVTGSHHHCSWSWRGKGECDYQNRAGRRERCLCGEYPLARNLDTYPTT